MNNNQIIDMQCNETTGRIMRPVAYIKSDFTSKFGIPRQSGLADLEAEIHFYPEYQNPEAVRGLEEYSHLWLIWEFSEVVRENWSPTVRPPRLGGNKRCGVFATRSPFRPNPIGLSCVRLLGIEKSPEKGMVVEVEGADLMDGTPILDIKPYLPYVDCMPDARGGFADRVKGYALEVEIPEELLLKLPNEQQGCVREILAEDPRPSYQNDPDRVYGMEYAGYEIKFRVKDYRLTVYKGEVLSCAIRRNYNLYIQESISYTLPSDGEIFHSFSGSAYQKGF